MAKEKPEPEREPAPPPKPAPTRRALPVITQNRMFAVVILIVSFAFLLSLIGLGVLALVAKDPPTLMQSKFAEACDFILKLTLGALVGLLGGRAAAPDRMEVGDRP